MKLDKKKVKLSSLIAMLVFGVVYTIILLQGTIFLEPGNEMGYTILNMYIILPATSACCSAAIGLGGSKVKWGVPVVFGVLGYLLPSIVFHSFSFEVISLYFAGIPSLLGMIVGSQVLRLEENKNTSEGQIVKK